MIGYALVKGHQSTDAIERDRLQVQARVVDDNVGQQLDGINRALASVRDEFLGTPAYSVSSLVSMRLKALSDAIPGVRSMVLLDSDGNVAATSVGTLLGRDFSNRDFFSVAKGDHNPATLHVAVPYKTSLGNYTVVFARAIVGPSGTFNGVVAAALEPEYFEVLMRSVLYAPDMWVSLGHSDGKVFVTMPGDASRVESDWQATTAALATAPSTPLATPVVVGAIGGSGEERMTALRYLSPPELHMDKPLVIAVSRALPEVFRPWRRQAVEYATSTCCSAPPPASVCIAANGDARPSPACRRRWRASVGKAPSSSSWRCRAPTSACGTGICTRTASIATTSLASSSATALTTSARRATTGAASSHPADALRMLAAIEAHFRGETPAYECEFRVRHKDGHWVWLLSRGKVVERDAFGIAVRMAGTHMDLSRRKRAEAELRADGRDAAPDRRAGEHRRLGARPGDNARRLDRAGLSASTSSSPAPCRASRTPSISSRRRRSR